MTKILNCDTTQLQVTTKKQQFHTWVGGNTPKWMVKISWKTLLKWMIWGFSPYFWFNTHISFGGSKKEAFCRCMMLAVYGKGFQVQNAGQISGALTRLKKNWGLEKCHEMNWQYIYSHDVMCIPYIYI